ncbi:hypothetical protein BAUCODRAFT_243344 [Baudoinia panamericana UAMH 10762]|uniref:Uncharacterized protein n=1 Tax=Baudoinia panamericana (strain UAMH 10762) TaxID=717646 RepID=M2MAK5_BAUPA|nr:uncharacterized protein BAUCODRAFT_243344 [Baudoinia panamericana UAMH 10762]EMC93491.1 hypothetical protein BAUCODRAFT_243344 [Baudoinia panamericana UAMH 10762]
MSYAALATQVGYQSPSGDREYKQTKHIRRVEPSDFPYERGLKTKYVCIAGLVLCWTAGIAITGFGSWVIYFVHTGQAADTYWYLPHMAAESVPLATNLLVTLLVEATGYIHTTSLRWALQREGRLNFNSNLRLCTFSKTSGPNKWYSNMIILGSVTMAYASSSLTFWHSNQSTSITSMFNMGVDNVSIGGIPILLLGFCFLTLAAMSTWALKATDIPCWSSSPLDTTLAAQHAGNVVRQAGRSMRSVHDIHEPSIPAYPQDRQGSAWRAHWEVRLTVVLLWTLVILCFAWAGIVSHLIRFYLPGSDGFGSWSIVPSDNTAQLYWEPSKYNQTINSLLIIFLFAILQGPLTFGLHCAELQVNLSRDEAFWRKATNINGCQLEQYDSVKAAFTSWQSLTLSAFKTILHWLFGLSVAVLNGRVYFGAAQIVYLGLLAAVAASFVTYITGRRPRGPQPAAYGHLQTLTNLIDEWSPTMYWGHKSDGFPAPHAGTAHYALPAPKNMPYL